MRTAVWTEVLGFLPLLGALRASHTSRAAADARPEAVRRALAPRCGHLRPREEDRHRPARPAAPWIEATRGDPGDDHCEERAAVLTRVLQCVHPCISLATGERPVEVIESGRDPPAPADPSTAAMIAGSFPLRELEWRVALSRDRLPEVWRPANIDIIVLSPHRGSALQFVHTVLSRVQRCLGCPHLLLSHRGGAAAAGEAAPLGSARLPPPLGAGLPALVFRWHSGNASRVCHLHFPLHGFDLSVCRVALWVDRCGDWVLEYPTYVWHDVHDGVLAPSAARCDEARARKYRRRGYRRPRPRRRCERCGRDTDQLWRGGCRRRPPYRIEWEPEDCDPPSMCGSARKVCRACARRCAGWCAGCPVPPPGGGPPRSD
eukprot:g2473.t1